MPSTEPNELPRVAILLAVYNGERFLQEQIDALANQTWPSIDVWASDDGSSDGSAAILKRAAATWSKGSFRILSGPAMGFAENFRSLIVNDAITADHYAFCDQDDIWDPHKLEIAIAWLGQHNSSSPRVFCSGTHLTTAEGVVTGHSRNFSMPPAFRNAIVQSIAGGNTMVMNHAARAVVAEASRRCSFIAHDWWTYIVTTGAGGVVHRSAKPLVRYRQHGNNLLGENNSWGAQWVRLRQVTAGRYSRWNEQNLEALDRCEDLLTEDARQVVRLFSAARSGGLGDRVRSLAKSGIYRQTIMGQLGLWVACVLKRL